MQASFGRYTRSIEGAWPIIFLMVVLKIPVFGGLWLIWWAARSYDQLEEELPPGGREDHQFRRWRRDPKPPRRPRRGPHGGGAIALPDCPAGARTHTAARPGTRKRTRVAG